MIKKIKLGKKMKVFLGIIVSLILILYLLVLFIVYIPIQNADKYSHWDNLTTTAETGEIITYKPEKHTKWDLKASVTQKIATILLKRDKANSYEPFAEQQDYIREDGVRVITEVEYATKYPNSFMDIYMPRQEIIDENSGKTPVFVYFHGGGFLFGTKADGDPIAGQEGGQNEFFNMFLERGIAVISGEYALGPEFRCPVQIEQVNQVMEFINANADEYCIDKNLILLGGGSAGADMTEVYGLFVSDSEYASNFNFVPAVEKDAIKGLIIDEAALDLRTFNNASMEIMLGQWVGESDLQKGTVTDLVDVPEHIVKEYIPTFVTGSTEDDFFLESALQLKAKLDEVGIRCDIYYPDESLGKFGHGFMTQYGAQASTEALEMLFHFVDDILTR